MTFIVSRHFSSLDLPLSCAIYTFPLIFLTDSDRDCSSSLLLVVFLFSCVFSPTSIMMGKLYLYGPIKG